MYHDLTNLCANAPHFLVYTTAMLVLLKTGKIKKIARNGGVISVMTFIPIS